MREYIAQKLNGIKDIQTKLLLREVLEEVFTALHDESEARYAALERRIWKELPYSASQYRVYGGVLRREQADGSHKYLSPMCPEDARPLEMTVGEAREALSRKGAVRLDTVFLRADYLTCREFEQGRRQFRGIVRAGGETLSARFRAVPAKRYLDCVENLYQMFLFNNLPWMTLNIPYLFKFFDVELVELGDGGETEQTLSPPEVSFDSYERDIRRGLLPVWNVRKLDMKGNDFPMPAVDQANYEYCFDLVPEGLGHGYLAEGNEEILGVRREETQFVAVSSREKGLLWKLYQLRQREESITDSDEYEVFSNGQEDSFAGRLISGYGTVIKTQAELSRLLQSFEGTSRIQLDFLSISWGETTGETYEVNRFIRDEVRDVACTKTMLLRFRAANRTDWLNRDLMSFLTSQVQLAYPEYRCTGVLI